ncbi:MAG: hypothetical protein MJA27_02095 [Pseudanabaenales cyanobacterium]|nr:hypothetical protein [Pseudanabaenales cyanobacterium]
MTSERKPFPLPSSSDPEILRVIAVGSLKAVENFVLTQYRLGYAEIREWSKPLPSPNSGEVMRILTKRIALDNS